MPAHANAWLSASGRASPGVTVTVNSTGLALPVLSCGVPTTLTSPALTPISLNLSLASQGLVPSGFSSQIMGEPSVSIRTTPSPLKLQFIAGSVTRRPSADLGPLKVIGSGISSFSLTVSLVCAMLTVCTGFSYLIVTCEVPSTLGCAPLASTTAVKVTVPAFLGRAAIIMLFLHSTIVSSLEVICHLSR